MRLKLPSACLVACLAMFVAGGPPTAWAGADADADHGHNPDEGPPFWGFVKDERGVPVRDAKVTASYKNTLTLVTRTTATGAYKVRGFRKDININDVLISCSKDGYKQLRVVRIPSRGKPIKSVETECRLQKL